MENAIWKNENLIASDVANLFELEREVRMASGRKELRCPDSGCKCPIVRYCHGEIKGAYFAHLTNDKCDYADFDKNDTSVFRTLRLKLFKHFSELGYDVRCEVKTLEHHYSQLYFELPNGNKITLEFGSNQTSANLIDRLAKEYESIGVGIRWLVVSDTNYGSRENELFYLKRYLVNESNKKEYIIISTDGTAILQSRWDCNKYEYNGRNVSINGFDDFYSEEADFGLLTIDNGELTISGFNDRYNQWLQRKKETFEEGIKSQIEHEKKVAELRRQAYEEQLRRKKELEKRLSEIRAQSDNQTTNTPIIPPSSYTPGRPKSVSTSYERRKAEIIGRMDQQEVQVRDSTDRRWIKCELCGKIGEDSEFSSYGGPNHLNLGVCSECVRKSRH